MATWLLTGRREKSAPADYYLAEGTEVTGGDKREGCFAYVDIDKAAIYGCEDVYGALLLWREFAPMLEERRLARLFHEVEMPLVAILVDMEVEDDLAALEKRPDGRQKPGGEAVGVDGNRQALAPVGA